MDYDRSVHNLNVLGERNDAEDVIDVHKCDAMLPVDNELDDLDAFHDAREIIEPLSKRCSASIGVGREYADGIWMKRKCGGVVVAHRMDVLLDDLYHLFAHKGRNSNSVDASTTIMRDSR